MRVLRAFLSQRLGASRYPRALADGPAQAFGETKRLIRSSWDVSRADHANDEADAIGRMVTSDDAVGLIQQFLGAH